MRNPVFFGNSQVIENQEDIEGDYVDFEGETHYKISNYQKMEPFFMSVVSHSDHWMFISSNGALSAGRKNEENALFPYYSDDKITSAAHQVGSKTILRCEIDQKTYIWEPFARGAISPYKISGNLYKNRPGNRLVFEEVNHTLQVVFQYIWQFSERYGFVKTSRLINKSKTAIKIDLLDGIQNIMPYGVSSALQNGVSNLANAYKRNELHRASGLAMFSLSSMVVDRAEPSEALKTTTVWSAGINTTGYLLSSGQVEAFMLGADIEQEEDIKGIPGSYFINARLSLNANDSEEWVIVAEVNQDRARVVSLIEELGQSNELLAHLEKDIDQSKIALKRLLAMSDGLQLTNDPLSTGRHMSNTLFNIMRGGIFDEGYAVSIKDFLDYLRTTNGLLYNTYKDIIQGLGNTDYTTLLNFAWQRKDHDLTRVCYEYLPLTFSRRHGDPSRPWNRFSIELKNPDGSRKRSYEGNWRDIFQNWEALAFSYPLYVQGMICKFLNASTIDGYNPYRITREGIDWEVIEPDDPWSYIGYWGDHQIIYLSKLMELAYAHDPSFIDQWGNEPLFVYANVPYRIKSYADIIHNPQDTVIFDEALERTIEERVQKMGADGKLIIQEKHLLHANFIEKILITLLTKLSNYIPDAGIWLNTQRPEWNDANNALVGNGASMVTLYYLRRFVANLKNWLSGSEAQVFQVNKEISQLFGSVLQIFKSFESIAGDFDDASRKKMVDLLGEAGETYRQSAYAGSLGNTQAINKNDLLALFEVVMYHLDHATAKNKRKDGLYHAYNIVSFHQNDIQIAHLYEMLEGQVAALSSHTLNAEESLNVLDALKSSEMFREDQFSYMLYPNRELPGFLSKNKIPRSFVENSQLANALHAAGNTELFTYDSHHNFYFNGDIHNAKDVKQKLDELQDFDALVAAEKEEVLKVFEQMFDHKSFTGRSGTFFAFEGLGSIYWHMVSKLLLAVQETIHRTWKEASEGHKGRLIEHYYEIRAGIGINKGPELYGAFPTDPYSHTPAHKGAQQPGMTGQVKEDIINRWAELGVKVTNGKLSFEPLFLDKKEFLSEPSRFVYFDLQGNKKELSLKSEELVFTYCQIPVIYKKDTETFIVIEKSDGQTERVEGQTLTQQLSHQFFARSGDIVQLTVHMTL